jgi:hypothetical protein
MVQLLWAQLLFCAFVVFKYSSYPMVLQKLLVFVNTSEEQFEERNVRENDILM